jgi:hypothetical protein
MAACFALESFASPDACDAVLLPSPHVQTQGAAIQLKPIVHSFLYKRGDYLNVPLCYDIVILFEG